MHMQQRSSNTKLIAHLGRYLTESSSRSTLFVPFSRRSMTCGKRGLATRDYQTSMCGPFSGHAMSLHNVFDPSQPGLACAGPARNTEPRVHGSARPAFTRRL